VPRRHAAGSAAPRPVLQVIGPWPAEFGAFLGEQATGLVNPLKSLSPGLSSQSRTSGSSSKSCRRRILPLTLGQVTGRAVGAARSRDRRIGAVDSCAIPVGRGTHNCLSARLNSRSPNASHQRMAAAVCASLQTWADYATRSGPSRVSELSLPNRARMAMAQRHRARAT
jgi:hypothetical protein